MGKRKIEVKLRELTNDEKIEVIQKRLKNTKFSQQYTCAPTISLDYIWDMETLLDLYKQEKEKNKELFEEYNKRVNTIIKYEQGIKYFIDETNITDIEPWSTYKINGRLLFDLKKLLEEE